METPPKARRSRAGGGRPQTRARWLRREDGALTLSYVIIIPVFLAGIMMIVQACVWYLARETAIGAARHGADVARTAQAPPRGGARAAAVFARQAAPGFLLSPSASAAGSSAATVRIRVTGRVPSLIPGVALTVSEVVTAPVERFTAAGRGTAARPGRPLASGPPGRPLASGPPGRLLASGPPGRPLASGGRHGG